MKKIFLGLGILITAGILFLIPASRAYVMPSVYVQDLTLNKTEFQSGDLVTGNFKIYSAATAVVPGIKYKFQILGGIVNNVPTITYYEALGGDTFVISPSQTIIKNFSHQLPKGLTGSYLLRIALVNEQGLPLGWEDQNISIKGVSTFVFLSDTYFVISDKKVDAGLGPTFTSEETPKIQFKAKNDSGDAFSLTPKIDIYQRTTEPNNLLKSYQENKINFTADSEQVVNLNLPKFATPQVYVASVKLFDGDRLASNVINFRWIIAGGGANIWQTNTDKTSYKAGEEAKVNVICTGSPDVITGPGTKLGKGVMEISLFNKAGEMVGKTQKEVDLDQCKPVTALVGIIKDVEAPTVKTEIIKDGNILASNQVSLQGETKEPTKPPVKIPYLWLIAIVALVIALILILRKLLMKKSLPNTPIPPISILLIPIIALIFFAGINSAKADVIVVDESYNNPTGENFSVALTYNQPQHNATYRKGNKIQFSGKVYAAWCVNSLARAYADFYLTDNNGSNKVKLNSERIYIGSVSGTGAEVSYNFSFTIPASISFEGPARAYIDYLANFYHIDKFGKETFRGTGWIIAYEHIQIIPSSAPLVDLKVNNEDGPITVEAPGTYTLSWQSWNSDRCVATSSAGDWSGVKTTSTGSDVLNTISTNIYTYKITCTGPGGPPATDRVTVQVNANPWVDLKVRNLKVSSTNYFDAATPGTALLLEEGADGADYELSWRVRRADLCVATSSVGDWSDSWASPPSFATTIFSNKLSNLYKYEITCSGPGGPAMTDKVFVNVFGNPKVDLKVNGQDNLITVAKNEVYSLSWQTWNVASCTAWSSAGDWLGDKPTSTGSSTSSQASASGIPYKYELTCSGSLGIATDTVKVSVKALPNCVFTANPSRVPKNGTSTLTVDCKDVKVCDVTNSNDATVWPVYSGSLADIIESTTTPSLDKPTIYTLTCSNDDCVYGLCRWKAMIGVFGIPNWWEIRP